MTRLPSVSSELKPSQSTLGYYVLCVCMGLCVCLHVCWFMFEGEETREREFDLKSVMGSLLIRKIQLRVCISPPCVVGDQQHLLQHQKDLV